MNRLFIIIVVALVAGAAQPGAQSNPELEKLFASAQHKATVEGEPRRAIADYELIVARSNGNRAIAARALMAIADAYRTLNDSREQNALKRIVNDYREQPAAARARERLAALTSAPARSAS